MTLRTTGANFAVMGWRRVWIAHRLDRSAGMAKEVLNMAKSKASTTAGRKRSPVEADGSPGRVGARPEHGANGDTSTAAPASRPAVSRLKIMDAPKRGTVSRAEVAKAVRWVMAQRAVTAS